MVNDFIHNELLPIIQSLKAHQELAHNGSFHISPKVLADITNRLSNLRQALLQLTEEKDEISTITSSKNTGSTGN